MFDLVYEHHNQHGPRDCRDCVHFRAGGMRPTYDSYEYDAHECAEVPRMSNLRSFPFKNTTCKTRIDHEQYNRPGPSGLSPRDVRQIQDRLGFRN